MGTDNTTTAILSARGSFYRVALDSSQAPGLYAVAGLNRPETGSAATGSAASNFPILISGVSTTQSDIISQVSCLENVKVLYTFGQNFGQLFIRGEVLMGAADQINNGALKQIEDFFWTHRVSKRLLPVAVSVADNAFYVYLTGLEVHDVLADVHVLPFVLFGVMLDLSRNDSSLINPKALVLTGGNLGSSSVQLALQQRKSALAVPDVVDNNGVAAVLPDPNAATTTDDGTQFDKQQTASKTSGTMTDPMAIVRMKQATGQALTPDEQALNITNTQLATGRTLTNVNSPAGGDTIFLSRPTLLSAGKDTRTPEEIQDQQAFAVTRAYNSTTREPNPYGDIAGLMKAAGSALPDEAAPSHIPPPPVKPVTLSRSNPSLEGL